MNKPYLIFLLFCLCFISQDIFAIDLNLKEKEYKEFQKNLLNLGDLCENPKLITVSNFDHNCKNFDEIDNTRDYSVPAPECWGDSDFIDNWFVIYANKDSFRIFSTESVAIYIGNINDCESLELITCGFDLVLGETEDNQQYFFVRTRGVGEFCINANFSIDSCDSDFELPKSHIYKTFSFIQSEIGYNECANDTLNNIWIKFKAETESVYIGHSSYNSNECNLSIYEGECSNLSLLNCYEEVNKKSFRINDLVIGEEYLLNYSATNKTNVITCKVEEIPPNEFFSSALEMDIDSCQGSGLNYLLTDTLKYTYFDTINNNSNEYPVERGLWYKITPKTDVYSLKLSYYESSGTLKIFKLDNEGKLKQLFRKYHDDIFNGRSFFANVLLNANTTYYIHIKSDQSVYFCVEDFEGIENYNFDLAHQLYIDSSDFNKATVDPEEMVHDLFEIDSLFCITKKEKASAWFSFETDQSNVSISLSGISSSFQVFEADKLNFKLSCPLFEGFSYFNFGFSSKYNLYDLDTTKKYYIRIIPQNSFFDHITSIKTITVNLGYPDPNTNDDFTQVEVVEICPPLSCVDSLYQFTTGINDVSNPDVFQIQCNPNPQLLKDIWFKFTATQNKLNFYYESDFNSIAFELYTMFDSLLYCNQEIYYTQQVNNDDQIIPIENLKIGETYFIRFLEPYDQNYISSIKFCIFESIDPPLNHTKENAINLESSYSLSECNSPEIYYLNSSENSVWFKFNAIDTFQQIVTNAYAENYFGLDATIYELDSNDVISDSISILHFDYFYNNGALNGDENATWLIYNGPNIGFLNFFNLNVGSDYLIKLGYRQDLEDYNLPMELRVPYLYQICLKSSSKPKFNPSIQEAVNLIPTDALNVFENGNATFSVIDYPENDNCFNTNSEFISNRYSDDWFKFVATQNSHTLFVKNYSSFSAVVDTFEYLTNNDFLQLNFSLYKMDEDNSFIGELCDLSIDSLFSINNLIVDETYYVHIYFNCYNYLTDLDFGIAISNLTDIDEDGFLSDVDCDDENPHVYPGNDEMCDDLDNNCNGMIDEDLQQFTYYLDSDGDGYGSLNDSISSCSQLTGYVENPLDCDDSNPEINPNAIEVCDSIDNNCDGNVDEGILELTFYLDADGDGFGNLEDSVKSCSNPSGYIDNSDDCDDNNINVNPGSDEICDLIDNNCDGLIDEGFDEFTFYQDLDSDGFGNLDSMIMACMALPGFVENSQDCNDTNPEINPGQEEIYGNDVDENCDGSITSVEQTYFREIGLEIFPNPTAGEVNIIMNRLLDYKVKLFGIEGQLINTYVNVTQLNISSLESGVYIIIVEFEKANYIKRLIKI